MALHFALTGGIGSGKSTVARLLVEHGAVLVDTDAIAHMLTTPGGAAMPALQREFGPEIVAADGAMDRGRMRERVFADATAKRRLEGILHPMIGAEAQRQAHMAGTQPVFFDVPLLTPGSPWRQRVRRILVVDCAEDTQVQRVMQRSGWTDEQVRRVIVQQTPRSARRALADAVIHNDGLDMPGLRDQVRALWDHWRVLPQSAAPSV
ncbi:MAG: dephospho-CoA kinase [Burkholderiales bacterium]|nr:dephospho-CoA kinase [Burkholderiales bacterium]